MAKIRLENLAHAYGPSPQTEDDFALKTLNLTWEDGKTYALLGPSGCGKTTMLNIISGLLKPSQGRLLFDDQDVTHASTAIRNIAQVFQFPVIYTTKTVRQNLAFPLICRGVSSANIAARVTEISELLDLCDMLDTPAKRLSADQKQLISLGRGLVREDVNAILLDEPLTVIDPQMKFALRRKLREINRSTGMTMILVTHDQSEAMTFADEIVVMEGGRLQQSGTPEELFAKPANEFVGYFIGSPPMNMVPLVVRGTRLENDSLHISRTLPENSTLHRHALGVRPEHIEIVDKEAPCLGVASICKIEHLGIDGIITLDLGMDLFLKAKTRNFSVLDIGEQVGIAIAEKAQMYYADGLLQD